ncbi:MAG TPA: 23S rRNA (adenine(2503)-C(2))-methyltransferase RlmN [Myxococcota bacterium]
MRPLRPNLRDFAPDALRARFKAEGISAYRADQVVQWLYARGVDDPAAMTDLPAELRERLASDYGTRALRVQDPQFSVDGTIKAALVTHDERVIEAVLIPEEGRTTLCVSTQVGCPLACSFCATGTLGLDRNLTTSEIVEQVVRMGALLPAGRRITNIVFMGMGEPLLNLANVVEAVKTLIHPRGFAMAPRRVTVSTAGVVPRIADLLEQVPVNLAVSLHAATDALRDELVPINKKFPLAELFSALRGIPRLTRRHPIFFEYTLLAGVNDSLADAERLVALLRGMPAKLNLIPVNPHPGSPYRAPTPEAAERFMAVVANAGLTVTLRRSRGADIDAACGQLAARSPAPAASSSALAG